QLLVERQDLERERRQVFARIGHEACLARPGALRGNARGERRERDAHGRVRTDALQALDDPPRDARGRTEDALGAGEIAGERSGRDDADVRERRAQRDERARMQRVCRVAHDDRGDQLASSASSSRVPRSLASAPSAVTANSARSRDAGVPAANDHPTVRPNRSRQSSGSTRTIGSAIRRPRSSATTSSAAGEPRTTGSSGARSSTSQRDANDGPTSMTTRRKPSLRSAAAPARTTSPASRARTTTTRSRSTPERTAASGSNDADGSSHATIPPPPCDAAATWSASASLPAVSGPMNASGSPARIPPPVTRSSDVPDAMRRSPSWRSATSPRTTARVPYLVSMRAIAAASPVAPTAAPFWPSHPRPEPGLTGPD